LYNFSYLSFPDFKVDSLSKTSEKEIKNEFLPIVQSTPDVQGKPNLRKRKKNTIYVESSDSDIDGISDEGMSFKYKHLGSQRGEIPPPPP